MNTEEIKQFLNSKASGEKQYVKIDFRTRDSIYGLFITGGGDQKDLNSKNFWRIVTRKHIDAYNQTGNADLAKIFNGSEFTRLSLLTDEF